MSLDLNDEPNVFISEKKQKLKTEIGLYTSKPSLSKYNFVVLVQNDIFWGLVWVQQSSYISFLLHLDQTVRMDNHENMIGYDYGYLLRAYKP